MVNFIACLWSAVPPPVMVTLTHPASVIVCLARAYLWSCQMTMTAAAAWACKLETYTKLFPPIPNKPIPIPIPFPWDYYSHSHGNHGNSIPTFAHLYSPGNSPGAAPSHLQLLLGYHLAYFVLKILWTRRNFWLCVECVKFKYCYNKRMKMLLGYGRIPGCCVYTALIPLSIGLINCRYSLQNSGWWTVG